MRKDAVEAETINAGGILRPAWCGTGVGAKANLQYITSLKVISGPLR